MLDSNEAMLEAARAAIDHLQQALVYAAVLVKVMNTIQRQFLRGPVSISSIYTKAVSGTLVDSPAVRELLLAVKKTPSDVLATTLSAIQQNCPEAYAAQIQGLTNRLRDLVGEDASDQPIRSEHDIRNDTLRTTVVAQKVQLSRHKAKLSEKDEAYSKIVIAFHDLLSDMFANLQNPLDMFGHEIVLYDLRMPHRAAMVPKPRFAIERALSSPHDYLNCQCCGSAAAGMNGEVC